MPIARVGNNQSTAGDSAADSSLYRRLFAAAMITGTNTMVLIRRILWREITVISTAAPASQLRQFRRCRNMADLDRPPNILAEMTFG
ncbi:hypothetical protein DMI65_19985 [Escherichia coli]|nr:hypothetical protein [Escherichia coli]